MALLTGYFQIPPREGDISTCFLQNNSQVALKFCMNYESVVSFLDIYSEKLFMTI